MCAQCLSDNVRIEPYDYGRDPETGYYDCGVEVTCLVCGAVSTAEEVDAAVARINAAEEIAERRPVMVGVPPIDWRMK